MNVDCALITGGLGFIGSHIAHRLIADRVVERVVLLDHYGGYVSPLKPEYVDYRKLRLKGIEEWVVLERGQAHHIGVIHPLLLKYLPRFIFHLASVPLASLENMNVQEAMEGNVLSTAYLLETCWRLKQSHGYEPERFVYTSSSMVYGDFQYSPADENHPIQPKGIYAATKLAGEICTRGLSKTFGIKSTIIRPSAVYGPTDMNRRVTQIFIENAIQGKRCVIQGKEEALDFTYVEDAAKGFVLAATRAAGIGETFNITSGQAHTLLEYVLTLKELFPDLEYEIVERDSSRPRRGTLATEKARRLLGYQPDHDLKSGIQKYVEFIRTCGSSPSIYA